MLQYITVNGKTYLGTRKGRIITGVNIDVWDEPVQAYVLAKNLGTLTEVAAEDGAQITAAALDHEEAVEYEAQAARMAYIRTKALRMLENQLFENGVESA